MNSGLPHGWQSYTHTTTLSPSPTLTHYPTPPVSGCAFTSPLILNVTHPAPPPPHPHLRTHRWGVFLTCAPGFGAAWQYVSVASPVVVMLLLRYVSGVPLLEQMGEQRWGTEPAFQVRAHLYRTGVRVCWVGLGVAGDGCVPSRLAPRVRPAQPARRSTTSCRLPVGTHCLRICCLPR
mgnify:CR=1 FL=1